MKIAVIGGSAAGLVSSILLARAGHEVVVFERESLEPAPDVAGAADAAFRGTAPQIVQPHVFFPQCRLLLQELLPDVYRSLLEAGVVEDPLPTQFPPTLPDRSAWPGDDRFTILVSRRSTVDWVLLRTAAAQPGVTLRGGDRVTELLATPGDPPRVTGVRTRLGEWAADLVIDATGRRSPVDSWLAGIDAAPSGMTWAECGLAYYARHYRPRPGSELPGPVTTRFVAALEQFFVGIWGGDNDTMQIALVPLAEDRRFRSARAPEVFTAAVRTVPFFAQWLDAMDPFTEVFPMGGLHNTLRRLVVDGRPVALGLVGVGDSVCTTNPTYGRGFGMLLRNVTDLVETLPNYSDDPLALALALDRSVGANIEPWYADQALNDAEFAAVMRHTALGHAAPPTTPPDPNRLTLAELRAAAPNDPLAFRAFFTIMGSLGHPDDTYRDPAIIARVREVLAAGHTAPRMAQPTAAELETALAAASA